MLLWFLSFVFPLDSVTWDDTIVGGLNFIEEYVLQIPFFLMALMRYITPTLDNMYSPLPQSLVPAQPAQTPCNGRDDARPLITKKP